ncbi:dopamine beta-hydroxylase-like [Babylonia areolata]|uniref:dopamine beta-hydroxylase-like n=1 Tax=Babylonia areolata TaxID=304850 RepID=UPI003FD51927
MLTWTILAVALCLPSIHPYPMYGQEIPNGDQVPHPCKPNFLWHGVGHQISQGGGARNPFGEDFAANGHKWTEALCRKDSDGDGRTNGEELGDPECVWSKGQTPPVTAATSLSHPGVCDPWNAVECVGRNAWLDCSRDEEFKCPAISEPDVRNITIRFPRTKVPAKETTYICFNFELPDDQEYHLIATEPFIDNHNVMHHIVLSTCDSSVRLMEKPEHCLMGIPGCNNGVGGWAWVRRAPALTPRLASSLARVTRPWHPCRFHDKPPGSLPVSWALHWTNPGLVDEWFDSSGMTLYYTPKLRQYNAAGMALGQTYLSIPPGQSSWVHQGTCTSRCSRKIIAGDLHVFSAQNHMHYLGIRQNITLTRPGKPLEVIADDNPYSYDSPKIHSLQPPLIIHPGDELTTHCTYQSRSRPKTTVYGEGSFEEMCFAFLSFYPAENMRSFYCGQWKDVDMCDIGEMCDLRIFNSSHPATAATIKKVLENCDPSGSCRVECRAAIEEVSAENNCLRDNWDYVSSVIMQDMYDPLLLKFAAAMESCPHRDGGEGPGDWTTPRPYHPVTERPSEPSEPKPEGPGSMLMNLVKSIGSRPLLQNIIMNVNYNKYAGSSDNDKHGETWH